MAVEFYVMPIRTRVNGDYVAVRESMVELMGGIEPTPLLRSPRHASKAHVTESAILRWREAVCAAGMDSRTAECQWSESTGQLYSFRLGWGGIRTAFEFAVEADVWTLSNFLNMWAWLPVKGLRPCEVPHPNDTEMRIRVASHYDVRDALQTLTKQLDNHTYAAELKQESLPRIIEGPLAEFASLRDSLAGIEQSLQIGLRERAPVNVINDYEQL